MPGKFTPPPTPPVAHPFLKWAGGKAQLLPQFEALYPAMAAKRRYLEPFLGSGAVYFHVAAVLAPRAATLTDNNAELIEAFTIVKDRCEDLIELLQAHRLKHGTDYYYKIRAQAPGRLGATARAARLIYLNKTCFNGLYRVNSRGLFNVPIGRYAKPSIVDPGALRAASAALAGAELRAAHFREVLREARGGDFVYFDPPYHPVSDTAYFTSYTAGDFGPEDQEELAHMYAELARRGCLVMLSNSDTPFVRKLYRDFDVRVVHARRNINSRGDRRGLVREVVVINYAPAAGGARPARGGGDAREESAPC
jgi:DNA adenine methylase